MGWEREGGVEGGEEEEINDTECRESKKKRNDRRKKRVEREMEGERGWKGRSLSGQSKS